MAKTDRGPSKFRNNLSRSYKYKKRAGIVKKRVEDNSLAQAKKARIVVRNLSFNVTESDFRRLYEPFGELEEVKLLKRPDGKLVGCGFVQFKNLEDASKAIFKTNKSNFLGRTISSEWAIPKSQFSENLRKEQGESEVKDEVKEEVGDNEAGYEEHTAESDKSHKKRKEAFPNKNALSKAEQRKLYKLRLRQKRSRIVIRNLPFTVTDEIVKEHFSKYGNIEELKILKKPDGTPTGVCFIQFDRVQCAAQAIHHENLKTLLNRAMVVDWAIPKDKFEKQSKDQDTAVKVEDDDDISIVKEEIGEGVLDGDIKIKEEKDSDEEDVKEENESDGEGDSGEGSDVNNDDEDDDNEDEEADDKIDIKREFDTESEAPHPRRISNDVSEGRTVFIKNVPFSATNEDLKQCMEQFGPVYYALICMDRLTEHSKGTAFVKFRNIEDAEKCLSAGTELRIHDQVLDPHRALHRNEVKEKSEEKKKKVKDSRNLYLVKEGVILAGSPAAQDISASDMAKRLQLEQWKSQMLRNLNMFVSRVRLVIHNLPASVDDAKLRQLFKNHSNHNAIITEARVMRDLRNVDGNGIGKSKEHGFVSFTNHEDALKALRSINNNPNIFTKTKRPIVAFSIENRIMVNAKQRRVEKSRQHNPLYADRKRPAENKQESESKEAEGSSKKSAKRKRKSAAAAAESKASASEDVESYAGTTGKPGVIKQNSKFFLKKQAAMHTENLKQQKKKAKSMKQLSAKKKELASNRREAKPKQGTKKQDADEANFSKLVNSYKNKLSSVSNFKSKWYEST
ncbi:hypothetical protein TSAR_011042 [Trichomalopsis sarcophagae]|uniref:RRM domain-containing protein n=1 Tax=Trichomalopsis sarcophagae TaxID=543379 RepID=A0A232F1J9_9HYME|nr:hypothetical protein TSAR_011042 [Trichomalopsis sarcophagae]